MFSEWIQGSIHEIAAALTILSAVPRASFEV